MARKFGVRIGLLVLALCLTGLAAWWAIPFLREWAHEGSPDNSKAEDPIPLKGSTPVSQAELLAHRFTTQVRPFLARYCISCHGSHKPKAALDLSQDATVAAVVHNARHWELVLERLQAREMPPATARLQPEAGERAAVSAWIRDLLADEARRQAGDPGTVLARRLSNAEFDYTIRDLTGIDIRPTREFPVDPANQAGFDNSGESLAMSPALLKKYLTATRLVADHLVLKPDGFVFAPHPAVTETDRDKYCVQRLIDFYQRHPVDYADYFLAAHSYRHRALLGRGDAALSRFAADAGLSARYLELIWSALNETEADAGPLAAVRKLWQELPPPNKTPDASRPGCERLRDLVVRLRKELKPEVKKLSANRISGGSQAFVLWRNRQLAAKHRSYTGDVLADLNKLSDQLKNADDGLRDLFLAPATDADKAKLRRALERFCAVFPLAFVVTDRGPYFDTKGAGKGRPLTAGFHLMQGYFRDDEPLCELILNSQQRRDLDALWQELNFVTLAPMRQYKDFIFFERAEPPRFMFEAEFDFARSEDRDATSAAKMSRLAKLYLAKAKKNGARGDALEAIETYFTTISAQVRQVERARLAAEPSHLKALLQFAERAARRPLAKAEQHDLLAYYRQPPRQGRSGARGGPAGCAGQRSDVAPFLLSLRPPKAWPGSAAALGLRPGQPVELFPLVEHARCGVTGACQSGGFASTSGIDGPSAAVAARPGAVRGGLATEFGGNWLDFRRFEEHNSVDRQRFPGFTKELRQAMFEEPIRYLLDVAQRNRSVLDLLYGKDTFVNPPLARHYGIPSPAKTKDWIHVEDAQRHGRGGLLPMAVFLTKNAPGLRTSPVKRGYWVVRRLLGEEIPPPPPAVPELPKDEANLGELTLPQMLARHRDDKNCAACHRRFDAVGLVFEDYGPVGERRTKDLGDRPVDTAARPFPMARTGVGFRGCAAAYLRDKRQDDFVDNLCRKLFSYALGSRPGALGQESPRRDARPAGGRRVSVRESDRGDCDESAVFEKARARRSAGTIELERLSGSWFSRSNSRVARLGWRGGQVAKSFHPLATVIWERNW